MKNNQIDFLIEALHQIDRIKLILSSEIEGELNLVQRAVGRLDQARIEIEDVLEIKKGRKNESHR